VGENRPRRQAQVGDGLGKGSTPRKPSDAIRKRVEFDAETWHALRLLSGDSMKSLQELAEEAFADLLKKHGRPITLKQALKESLRRQPANDPRPKPKRSSPSLKGKWRIVEMKLWDKSFIDLVGPGFIAFDGKGRGEFGFGAVTGTMDCSDVPAGVDFTWEGSDEMDEARGEGWVELQSDSSLVGEISFHDGDESGFRARPFNELDGRHKRR
jgi:hypothetical protein